MTCFKKLHWQFGVRSTSSRLAPTSTLGQGRLPIIGSCAIGANTIVVSDILDPDVLELVAVEAAIPDSVAEVPVAALLDCMKTLSPDEVRRSDYGHGRLQMGWDCF